MIKRRTFSFIPSLAFIIGFCSITFEIIWMRLIGFNIGSSGKAMAVVVAAVMLGFTVGSFLALKFNHNITLKRLALLEILAAIWSVIVTINMSSIFLFFLRASLITLVFLNFLGFKTEMSFYLKCIKGDYKSSRMFSHLMNARHLELINFNVESLGFLNFLSRSSFKVLFPSGLVFSSSTNSSLFYKRLQKTKTYQSLGQ